MNESIPMIYQEKGFTKMYKKLWNYVAVKSLLKL